ncbi:hypothetical protein M0804_014163 [Polistes exclamans]|nr:hypothetical protein M0804_014163 [Polistes exclamans]
MGKLRPFAVPVTRSLEPAVLDRVIGCLFPQVDSSEASDGRGGQVYKAVVTPEERLIATKKIADGKVPGPDGGVPSIVNLHGPKKKKRRLYGSVIHLVLFYGAPVWWRAAVGVSRIRRAVRSFQRKVAIRVCYAYKTASSHAVMMIAELISLDHFAPQLAEAYVVLEDAEGSALGALTRRKVVAAWREEEFSLAGVLEETAVRCSECQCEEIQASAANNTDDEASDESEQGPTRSGQNKGATDKDHGRVPEQYVVELPFQKVLCKICLHTGKGNYMTLTLDNLISHLKEHKASVIYKCSRCKKEYKRKHPAQCHMPKCTGPTPHNSNRHMCSKCGEKFKTKSGLSQHQRHRHPAARNEARAAETARGEQAPKDVKAFSKEEIQLMLELEVRFQGSRMIAHKMTDFIPTKTNKQIRDKRNESAYKRMRDEYILRHPQKPEDANPIAEIEVEEEEVRDWLNPPAGREEENLVEQVEVHTTPEDPHSPMGAEIAPESASPEDQEWRQWVAETVLADSVPGRLTQADRAAPVQLLNESLSVIVLERVKKLALKPYQKVDLISTYLVPHYLFQLTTAVPNISQIRALDQELRVVIKDIYHLPQSTTNGLIYSGKKDGGLGFPKLEIVVVSASLKAGLKFANSTDPAMQALALGTGMVNRLKNLAKAVRINWPVVDAKDIDKYKIREKKRELASWASLSTQGKSVKSLAYDKIANACKQSSVTQSEGNGGYDLLAHILGQCQINKAERIRRHDEIKDLVMDEIMKRDSEATVTKEVTIQSPSGGNLKPDLTVRNQKGVFVVDITVRLEDNDYLAQGRNEKSRKYSPLLPLLQREYGATAAEVLPLVAESLESRGGQCIGFQT